MKLLMLLGAVVGFAVGLVFSLLQKSPGSQVIWHAALAAYAAGMLFRWWGRLWERNLRASLLAKQAEATAVATPPEPAKK